MNVLGGNNQHREPWDIGQRVDLVAPPDAEGAAAEKKERDVRTQRCRNCHQSRHRNGATGEPQISTKRGCRIAGTSAQAATGGDFLTYLDFDTGANFKFSTQQIHRFVDQILSHRLQGERIVSLDMETNTGGFGLTQEQLVMQRNGLQDGAEFVVGVRTLAENIETEIDFGEGWDSNFAHAPIAA